MIQSRCYPRAVGPPKAKGGLVSRLRHPLVLECEMRPLQSEVLSWLTGLRVRASVRPYIHRYVTEGESSLLKWRQSPRLGHDVLCGKSLRRGIQTALCGVCKMHRVIGRVQYVYCKDSQR